MPPHSSEKKIIIIKRLSGKAHGHHGGSWKIAYADFVTAMMAFFLLMWLLNVTTDEVKKGIADYFSPNLVNMNTKSGNMGIVQGSNRVSADHTESDIIIPQSEDAPESDEKKSKHPSVQTSFEKAPQKDVNPKKIEKQKDEVSKDKERIFAQNLLLNLKNILKEKQDLKDLLPQILFDETPDGVRIQLIDNDTRSMFPSGSAMMHGHMENLLKVVAQVVQKLPNKISISGHTDSIPYSNTKNYSNWELSSDRAHACRRFLEKLGIKAERFESVTGKEATQPLIPENKEASQNRRISIMVLK